MRYYDPADNASAPPPPPMIRHDPHKPKRTHTVRTKP